MQESQAAPDSPVHVEYDIKVTPKLVWAIVAPYVSEKFMEQLKSLLPVSVFLFAFQLLVLRQGGAIVSPYVSEKFMEQLKSLLPVSVFLFAFQLLVLRQGVAQAVGITAVL